MAYGVEAATKTTRRKSAAIGQKVVTYDFARPMEGSREGKCSAFASAIIERM